MTPFAYTMQEDTSPRLGLVVLQVDETIEQDFRRLFAPDVARLHVTRVPSGAELTPETIAGMAQDLPHATRLLPRGAPFDAVAYACTSGTTLIGADHVHALVRDNVPTRAATDPLTAALAACARLGITRLGVVSPYLASVADPLRRAFVTAGIDVPHTLSFGEEVEARVARIAPASIRNAAVAVAGRGGLDAIFLSCTNLRTLDILAPLEDELGLPVLSSNQVLAWHMVQLAGVSLVGAGAGRLLDLG